MFETFKIPVGSRESRIRKNVMKRQALKKKWDRHCKYGESEDNAAFGAEFSLSDFKDNNDNFVRLLDEGVVVDGDGYAFAVIKKGALKTWYDNLSNSFKGSINKDHIPAVDLGKFTKKDLRLVELGNGRYGIDVNVKLDDELYAVKDLKRMMNRKAVSSEFCYDAEVFITAEDATGDKKQGKWLIPVIDTVMITGYAVVDNPKNANSYDENLLEKASASDEFAANDTSERNKMTKEELEAKKTAEMAAAGAESDEANEATEAETEDAEDEATETETEATETEPETEATEEDADDAGDEAETDGEGEKSDAEDNGEKDEENEADDEISTEKLAAAIKSLKAEMKAKDDKIADLEAKLSNSKKSTKKLEGELTELFNFATSDEPTDEEGGETTTEEEEKDGKTEFENALDAAFKEMEG